MAQRYGPQWEGLLGPGAKRPHGVFAPVQWRQAGIGHGDSVLRTADQGSTLILNFG